MVSFLPNLGRGNALCDSAMVAKQQNSNTKPINFIILRNTKIMLFFVVLHNIYVIKFYNDITRYI
ncbi:hypothetical protein GCM10028826_31790 [Mucilaginibacter boryungensis]